MRRNDKPTDWVPVDELLKTVDEHVDEESDGDDEQQELAVLRQDRGDTYAWETGYNAAWKTNVSQGSDQAQRTKCVFYPVKDPDGKVEEVKSLYLDRDNRINRPYFDTYEYQQQQYFNASKNKPNVMRSLVVLLDYSEAMKEADYKPNRITCLKPIMETFVVNFFKHSPISKVSFCLLTNKDAVLLSPLCGSPEILLKQLTELTQSDEHPCGDPSIQAGLERACLTLDATNEFSTKEILLVYGSSLTNDAGDIQQTLKGLLEKKIRMSCVSLAPEMKIVKDMCRDTQGSYVVCMSRPHLRDAIVAHAMPQMELPPMPNKSTFVLMGFPDLTTMSTGSLCVCHGQLGFDGYLCPRCQIRCCSIPTECKGCGLSLVSSIDIARCQVMDALPPPFIPLPENCDVDCFLCFRKIVSGGGQCSNCHSHTCFDCDILIHSTFKFCPGCATRECLIREECQPPPKNPLQQVPANHPLHSYLETVVQVNQSKRLQLI
eukprot:Blabericola_migrator_1__3875@NODE_216_length_11289_cov_52_870166_g183_i0_p4_GENE_NODE_216_length_11289_cov_52_870166_g183_i0NODE_216_length_11289_cov_52_870166_g183_i0_p4_ORF_typecomplete_len489_score100_92Ssl1/PF04056_14/1e50VWA_2/PF13519_6/7_5e07Tfb4/PF03850_14/4_8e06Tfb4/PF03850_14/8e03C1_4/PF07975_12/1_8e04C1_4/PF07975_12/5_4e05VWA/PF00092_28/0_00066_NODE_216_length_11289_cov_52_870166_g183_i052106676